MTTGEPLPKKVCLSETDFKVLARDELILRWKEYEAYVQALEDKYTELNSSITSLRESGKKLRQQQQSSTRRKDILVMRLATKEQEVQEYYAQIQHLQQPGANQLASALTDPTLNFFFLQMKEELEMTKAKLGETQDELSAWKFTPASQTGKDLMARCRMLIQENQKLGRQVNRQLIAQLEAELALQKKYSEELKSSSSELSDFIMQLEKEVEDMQSTILVLRQQLTETHQQLAQYQEQQPPALAPSTSRATPEPEPQIETPGTATEASRSSEGHESGVSPTASEDSHAAVMTASHHDPPEEKTE